MADYRIQDLDAVDGNLVAGDFLLVKMKARGSAVADEDRKLPFQNFMDSLGLNTYAKKAGDTFIGPVILNNNVPLQLKGTNGTAYNAAMMNPQNFMIFGGASSGVKFQSQSILSVIRSGVEYKLYSEFNKPTTAELGVYSKDESDAKYLQMSGGTITALKIESSTLPSLVLSAIGSGQAATKTTLLELQLDGSVKLIGRGAGAIGANLSDITFPKGVTGTVYTTGNNPTLSALGAAKSGINSDITALTNLTGPLRVGADGISLLDAVTVQQLNNYVSSPANMMTTDTAQDVTGIKTITNKLMTGTSAVIDFRNAASVQVSAPATNNEVANKKYVDDVNNAPLTGDVVIPTDKGLYIKDSGGTNKGVAKVTTDGAILGDVSTPLVLTSSANPSLSTPFGSYTFYHTGNRPTLDTVYPNGPFPLKQDAVAQSDAVTLRQLQIATAGNTGGATMNGVMNNFIGSVEWFNGTRARLPVGHISSDGQILVRAENPELWAAVKSGMLLAVADSLWLSGPLYHGVYSYGDGDVNTGTTFRAPDLNGVYVNSADATKSSIRGLFLRGDGHSGSGLGGGSGAVRPDGAPNIVGSVTNVYGGSGDSTRSLFGAVDGAFVSYGNVTNAANMPTVPASGTGSPKIGINASLSHLAYGRTIPSGGTAADEVAPAHAVGIWLIRSKGIFDAQTELHVITSDAIYPTSAGTVMTSGQTVSDYKAAGVVRNRASFGSQQVVGGSAYGFINAEQVNASGVAEKGAVFKFGSDGNLSAPNEIVHRGGKIVALSTIVYPNGTEASPALLPAGYRNTFASPYPDRVCDGRLEVLYNGEWGEAGMGSNAGSGSVAFGAAIFFKTTAAGVQAYTVWAGANGVVGSFNVVGGAWDTANNTSVSNLPYRIRIWTID
ncbi:tail fiber protein [Yersinia phage vB_YenM_P778]